MQKLHTLTALAAAALAVGVHDATEAGIRDYLQPPRKLFLAQDAAAEAQLSSRDTSSIGKPAQKLKTELDKVLDMLGADASDPSDPSDDDDY